MDELLTLGLMIIDCIVGAFGALYMKKGAAKFSTQWKKLLSNLKNKNLLIGLFLYIVSASLLVVLLKYNKLIFIYPLSSLTYIFIVILSSIMLNERITKYKMLAIALIVLGNIFITL
jgi:drug/metabolite transporter (DMT)-like permease